jgi:hypothetical protein
MLFCCVDDQSHADRHPHLGVLGMEKSMYEGLVYTSEKYDPEMNGLQSAGTAPTWDEAYQAACKKVQEIRRNWESNGEEQEMLTAIPLVRPQE